MCILYKLLNYYYYSINVFNSIALLFRSFSLFIHTSHTRSYNTTNYYIQHWKVIHHVHWLFFLCVSPVARGIVCFFSYADDRSKKLSNFRINQRVVASKPRTEITNYQLLNEITNQLWSGRFFFYFSSFNHPLYDIIIAILMLAINYICEFDYVSPLHIQRLNATEFVLALLLIIY